MRHQINLSRIPLVASVVCLVLTSGCGTLRLPRIDPSGQSIFLPSGNYTTLTSPAIVPGIPEPAYSAPDAPPPCGDPPPAPPYSASPGGLRGLLHHKHDRHRNQPCGIEPQDACGVPVEPSCGPPAPATQAPSQPSPTAAAPATPQPPAASRLGLHRRKQGQLMLAPGRILAPIGSEVVLVAGLAGEAGEYLPRIPLEWSVSQDSVGGIVAADDAHENLHRLLHASHKRSGDYAVTKTSTSAQVLTRGTTKLDDDISILRGQSWITLTSPNEGTSYVSVVAPNAANWDQRRQTATIHWVDVVWTFPGQAILHAGQPHTLTTTVMKNSGKPLTGWIVRYEIAGAAPTSFAANQQSVIDIPVDANGNASVNLNPAGKNSFARVDIKVIRPTQTDDDLPQMIVGKGSTSVTWSAPDPEVTLRGPRNAGIGTTIAYETEVANVGDIVAQGVVATAQIPGNMTYLSSEPPAQIMGNTLQWPLGDLEPQARRNLRILFRPERNGNVRFCLRAESQSQVQGQNLVAEACVETNVFSSSLTMRLTGPATARVGETMTFQIEVRNSGHEPLNRVVIRDRLPPGMRHTEQQGNLIEYALQAPLGPGQAETIDLELIADQTGQLCHTVEATADEIHTATESTCVQVQAPPPPPQPKAAPGLELDISGPAQAVVGDNVMVTVQARNNGNVPLTNLRVLTTYDGGLFPKQASDGFDMEALRRGEIIWFVPSLAPGESLTREAQFECRQPAESAAVRVNVQSPVGVNQSRETRMRIRMATPPATDGAGAEDETADGPPKTITGELRVSIADRQDPIKKDETTTYIVAIENGRNVEDKDVTMTILLPRGLEFVKLSGPVGASGRSQDGKTINVMPVKSVRAGESLNPFFIEVKGLEIGKHVLRVKVDSFYSRQPVEAVEDTTVTISG